MLGDFLSHRAIQARLALFALCVGRSLLYSRHVHRTTETELAQHERFLKERPQSFVTSLLRFSTICLRTSTPATLQGEIK